MGSAGTSRSLRGQARAHTFTDVGASEGFAAARVMWICVLWALIHSVLASKQAKNLARRVAGPRYRDGLYRSTYNVQSVVLLLWAARRFTRLPDQELYRVSSPWSWLFRTSQVASLGVLLSGVRVMGILNFAGIAPLWDFLRGKDIRPEPEAQGPPIGVDNEVAMAGAFRFTRHPGNLGALGFFLFTPRMTANRAVLIVLVTLYIVLGSMHEEYRLQAAYGDAYERYRRVVPFLVPRRPSTAVTAHSLIVAALSVIHSLRTRGLRRTLLFAALGNAIPILGELLAVRVLRMLRHHMRPQVKGVPLAIALGWYNVGYGTLAIVKGIVYDAADPQGRNSLALASATALAATNLDILLDPFGLDLGLWEWSEDGPYAPDIKGPNGKRGVPLLNFGGWIALTTVVTLAYQHLQTGGNSADPPDSGDSDGPSAERAAALLLLSYYLPATLWALKRRRRKYLLYSAPFATTLWEALR